MCMCAMRHHSPCLRSAWRVRLNRVCACERCCCVGGHMRPPPRRETLGPIAAYETEDADITVANDSSNPLAQKRRHADKKPSHTSRTGRSRATEAR